MTKEAYLKVTKRHVSPDKMSEELAKAIQLAKEINIPGTKIIVEREEKDEN